MLWKEGLRAVGGGGGVGMRTCHRGRAILLGEEGWLCSVGQMSGIVEDFVVGLREDRMSIVTLGLQ